MKTAAVNPIEAMVKSVKAVTKSVMSVNDAWNDILTNRTKYFHVKFRLKNKAKDGRPAGTIREMTCRLIVHKYKNRNTGLGSYCIPDAVRWAEDEACNVLTCWDVEKYHELRRSGLSKVNAGRGAYRRINLAAVLEIK